MPTVKEKNPHDENNILWMILGKPNLGNKRIEIGEFTCGEVKRMVKFLLSSAVLRREPKEKSPGPGPRNFKSPENYIIYKIPIINLHFSTALHIWGEGSHHVLTIP